MKLLEVLEESQLSAEIFQRYEVMMERTFKEITEDKIHEADQRSTLLLDFDPGIHGGTPWKELLQSKRVMMVAEAGTGKTYECEKQAKRLWDEGEPAFFIDLATLASENLRDILDLDQEARLDQWLSSQDTTATFFLDSIDELRLSRGSFKQAIIRFTKGIGNQLGRVRIVITTRPIAYDHRLVRELLPVPTPPLAKPTDEEFVQIAMSDVTHSHESTEEESKNWKTVELMSLSDRQIMDMAIGLKVTNPEALIGELRKRNALLFARRPQDLIELCAEWRENQKIGTHREQIHSNIQIKLRPAEGKPEQAELHLEKAIEGARRLALAMLLTRRLTLRHDAKNDSDSSTPALDPRSVLSDWTAEECRTLLERALFIPATYGRVRFHHRSVLEYLAASRLNTLSKINVSFKTLKRLLFTTARDKTIVLPSKRPVAAWLALENSQIFELLRDHDPAVLLDEGDPESLTLQQRKQSLTAYVNRYGKDHELGSLVPNIQIHRFASPELASHVNRLWQTGVDNPDVQKTLLHLIGTGHMSDCADIAYEMACNAKSEWTRIWALDALISLQDTRLETIADSMSRRDVLWPSGVIRNAIPRMYPRHLSSSQLCEILSWQKENHANRSPNDLNWELTHVIENGEIEQSTLEELRDGVGKLMGEALHWDEWHFTNNRSHLSDILAATCTRGLKQNVSDNWLRASALALLVEDPDNHNNAPNEALKKTLSNFSSSENARFFWVSDALIQEHHVSRDAWARLMKILSPHGPVDLQACRDLSWIKTSIDDKNRSIDQRVLMLTAAIWISQSLDNYAEHFKDIEILAKDEPALQKIIEASLKPSDREKLKKKEERKNAALRAKEEKEKAASKKEWLDFKNKVSTHPEVVFSQEQMRNTSWNLCLAMSKEDSCRLPSGWNRRFLEEHFDNSTANRLREALMVIWRKEQPTLVHERPEGKRNVIDIGWYLGLAALRAEAEDHQWVEKITIEEAMLAARYAPLELNAFPAWLQDLSLVYPNAVDATLGEAMNWELQQDASKQQIIELIWKLENASSSVADVFLPRLMGWLATDQVVSHENAKGLARRTRQVADILLKHGNHDLHSNLLNLANQRLNGDFPHELTCVWLNVLIRIDPPLGVAALQRCAQNFEPDQPDIAATFFDIIFGDRRGTAQPVNLRDEKFTPEMLFLLTRLAYQHVRPAEDIRHDSAYSPDTRDHAQQVRHEIETAFLLTKGADALALKLEWANDPLLANNRHYVLAKIERYWAEELDSAIMTVSQFVEFDRKGETQPSTPLQLFTLMMDRLDDINELLLSDASPRETWAGIAREKLMRREIARELENKANGLYKVGQEAVTGDEKETDIRLHSNFSGNEAVIELKLVGKRSFQDLFNTISEQLVKKYMATSNRRSGCLLLIIAKDRKWDHPTHAEKINIEEVLELLRDEAKRIEASMEKPFYLGVHLLDLRPRLLLEKETKN